MTKKQRDNKRRAQFGADVLRYIREREGDQYTGEDEYTIAVDLLANLMHWAQSKNLSPLQMLDSASGHWIAEK